HDHHHPRPRGRRVGRPRARAARGRARGRGIREGLEAMRPLGRGREVTPGTTVLAHLHRSNGYDVYDAWNEPRGCRVIVTTLRPDRLRRPAMRRALLREGRALRRLVHPHIVRGYEVH